MKKKPHHKGKRNYQKLAAALGSAAVIAASIIPSVAAFTVPPAPDPQPTPIAEQSGTDQSAQNVPPEEAGAKQVLDVKATAYAPGPHDNDQWGNKTRMGTQIRPGVIAVDPRVIPLGSKVMIKYPDGTKEYAVAEDTGGAIKGNRIDVARWKVSEANNFGIKPVKVYVLETPAQPSESQV